jgi:crotonobetainyl-CoA:carnitine CoA-transferase CaiB-like acyl-CoA transferase
MSAGGPHALTGLRVVEATEGIAGAYATKLLADLAPTW